MSEQTFNKNTVKEAITYIKPTVKDEEIKGILPELVNHLDEWLKPKADLTEDEIEEFFYHSSMEILSLKEMLPHRKKYYQQVFNNLMKKVIELEK